MMSVWYLEDHVRVRERKPKQMCTFLFFCERMEKCVCNSCRDSCWHTESPTPVVRKAVFPSMAYVPFQRNRYM